MVQLPPTKRLGDANRRAVLGALAVATDCSVLGYVTDTNLTIDGRPTEALL